MPNSATKLTYYNRTNWQTVLFRDGARVVTPYRMNGRRKIGATTRHYRGLAQNRQQVYE